MLLTITYPEIQDLIKQKTQKDIRLSSINDRTICASTSFSLPLIGTKEVKVLLTLEEINNEYALLSYNNGLGVDLIIIAVLKYLEMQSNVSFIQGLPDNRIKIQLNQISQLQSALKAIDIHNMIFEKGNAILEFGVK